jgi:hypothetical protein
MRKFMLKFYKHISVVLGGGESVSLIYDNFPKIVFRCMNF